MTADYRLGSFLQREKAVSTASMTSSSVDEARTARIKAAIRAESERVRARFGFLNHQNAIGASIMALSVLGMIASGWAYIAGVEIGRASCRARVCQYV